MSPGRAARGAGLSLRGHLDPRPRVHARRDVDDEGAAAAHAALAGAVRAGLRDRGAVPLARRARSGRHDLAEERPRDALDRAAAAAHLARAHRRPGAAAGAAARAAHDRRVDRQLAPRPEGRLGEVDVEAHEGVLPPARSRHGAPLRLPAAEERLEDVLEPEAATLTAVRRRGVGAHVVRLTLVGVAEDLVGACDVLEPVLGVRPGDVRVQLAGELAVGLLDLVLARVTRDAENLVVVRHEAASWWWDCWSVVVAALTGARDRVTWRGSA